MEALKKWMIILVTPPYQFKYVPQPEETTFAFSSVFILLLCLAGTANNLVECCKESKESHH